MPFLEKLQEDIIVHSMVETRENEHSVDEVDVER
jgi:hypothetical protein